MITSELIKKKARELGASVCGIGKIYSEPDKQRDPLMILPSAKCIIGFGFSVPRGLYYAMKNGNQIYTYTSLGVKHAEVVQSEIFLLKMTGLIEDDGYDACPQCNVPHLRVKGDKTTNPEPMDTYELIFAEPVAEGKPAPDVMLDFAKAAEACGIGKAGISGSILNEKYGPFMRYCFIITDAPLDVDENTAPDLCDGCMECARACPAHAISDDGKDSWQCAPYYKGAHKSNPYITDEFLKGHPDREKILNGEYRFDAQSARAIYPELNFLPDAHSFSPCMCAKACDIACYEHLKALGKLTVGKEADR